MERVDALVIGAGVVGLAVARALARAGREVVIVEQGQAIGTGVSSRNSEVVHAGLYYPSGSLRARLCVRGRQLLYRYCEDRAVAHRRCGKLVVATRDEELPRLRAIADQAERNGVSGDAALHWLSRDEARAREPALECRAALWSPASGIVDSHGLMTSLLADAQGGGALLALASPFDHARRSGDGWMVATGGAESFELEARWVINAAGLHAQTLAARMQGFPGTAIPPLVLSKGHYFALTGRAPFRHLVYPTPVEGGLGVHLTLDLGGQARFGPDVQWLPGATVQALDYAVDASRAAAFEADIRRYWPGLPEGALQPAYSGIRPRLTGPGQPVADFRVDGPAQHGVPGMVQLFGIESPGLTASLAIAEQVAAMVVEP